MVAALFIDPRGPYPKLEGVDCWDEHRDAKLYRGPHPVIAHPPCGPWGRLKFCSQEGEAIKALGPIAVDQARTWGGVLEHPRGSKLFAAMGMPRPGELPDRFGGITIEVNQVEWGHVARKPTWLYMVGVRGNEPAPYPGRAPTHWISGFRSTTRPRTYDRAGSAVPPGIKVCSAQQRRRTPPLFAEYLVRLARSVKADPLAAPEPKVNP